MDALPEALVALCAVLLAIAGISALRLKRRARVVVRRAAFDIGSGATKLLVADVDENSGVVVGTPLLAVERPLAFKADSQANRGRLSDGICEMGLELMRSLSREARALGAHEACGIATEVFRTAPNGLEYLESIRAACGVRVRVLSQSDESRLGLATAEALCGGAGGHIISWDSGGGSFQICAREPIRPQDAPISAAALRSVDHRGGLDAFLSKAKDTELSANALKVKKEIAKAQTAEA